MVLLATVLQLMIEIVLENVAPNLDGAAGAPESGAAEGAAGGAGERLEEADPIAFAFRTLGANLVLFALVSLVAWFVGRQAGGKGRFTDVMSMVGWHALAGLPLQVVFLLVFAFVGPSGSGFASLLFLAVAVYLLYLFAAFIAEAHGFQNVGLVMAASFGVLFAFSFVSVLVLARMGLLEMP